MQPCRLSPRPGRARRGFSLVEVLMVIVALAIMAGVVIPQVQAGKLRVIGTTGAKRAAVFPDVPTLIESGLPGFEAVSWYGFLTTGGTPQPMVDLLSRTLIDILNDPVIRESITRANMEPASAPAIVSVSMVSA